MARTTGVSNPVRSPSFRLLASGAGQEAAFATGVPPDIYAFHTTPGIPLPSSALKPRSMEWPLPVEPGDFTSLTRPPAGALRPVNPDNACHLRFTAAAGT